MKLAALLVAVFVCSSNYAAAPTASVDPDAAPNKIDMSRPPPPPANVNVLNFPETQAVEGTVTVSNLPAVQTVGGTVSVGNLPLDEAGAVRVTNAPARQMVWYELVNGPIEHTPGCVCRVWNPCGCTTLASSIDSAGYSRVGILVRTDGNGGAQSELWARWAADEAFARVVDAFGGTANRAGDGERMIYPAPGGNVALHVEWYPGTGVQSARIYLMP